MSDLTYKPKPGRVLARGALIDAQDCWGRTRQVRVLSFTIGGPNLEAWDANSGRPRRVWLQTYATARKDVPVQLGASELARNA